MGQKIHPFGFRVGITRPWVSRWYAKKADFGNWLVEDQKIKKFVRDHLPNAGIAKVEIERSGEEISVFIHTSRPGVVIGKKGAEIDSLRDKLQKFTAEGSGKKVQVNIKEISRPDLVGQLVAQSVAEQIEKRTSFRRAMKKAMETCLSQGVQGIKILCAGRLAGAEIARSEKYMMGSVPLHTLDADVDYGFAEAKTTYGLIGVKVWLYKGNIVKETKNVDA